jgi:ComF family protein
MFAWLLDLVFPARCIVCERRGSALCPGCVPALPYLPPGLCARCASRRGARGVCRGCRRLSPALSWVRAPLVYDGAARRAVIALKFRSGRCLAPVMGELLRQTLRAHPVAADLLVPVPLSPGRLRQRGFNQAALLADQIAGHVPGIATVRSDVLVRQDRPAQRTLNAHQRLSNLAGAFGCPRPADVRGRRILLVDDVVTTGATASACADTLADAGAARICVLAFARHL